MALLSVRGVSKTYHDKGEDLVVLSDVRFDLEPHSLNVLCGPSGSGKTTLLNIIAGLDRPDKGEVLLEGKKVEDLSMTMKTRVRSDLIGIIFQNPNLVSYLTALENAILPAVLAGVNVDDVKQSGILFLDRLGLAKKMNAFPARLSEGERRRVSIARGLISNPKLILADEPTANLDSENSEIVLGILKESAEKDACILLSTHDERITALANRTMRISYGRVES